jgi:hypothetical protein
MLATTKNFGVLSPPFERRRYRSITRVDQASVLIEQVDRDVLMLGGCVRCRETGQAITVGVMAWAQIESIPLHAFVRSGSPADGSK